MKEFINEVLEYTEWTPAEAIKNVVLTVAVAPVIYGVICLAFLVI